MATRLRLRQLASSPSTTLRNTVASPARSLDARLRCRSAGIGSDAWTYSPNPPVPESFRPGSTVPVRLAATAVTMKMPQASTDATARLRVRRRAASATPMPARVGRPVSRGLPANVSRRAPAARRPASRSAPDAKKPVGCGRRKNAAAAPPSAAAATIALAARDLLRGRRDRADRRSTPVAASTMAASDTRNPPKNPAASDTGSMRGSSTGVRTASCHAVRSPTRIARWNATPRGTPIAPPASADDRAFGCDEHSDPAPGPAQRREGPDVAGALVDGQQRQQDRQHEGGGDQEEPEPEEELPEVHAVAGRFECLGAHRGEGQAERTGREQVRDGSGGIVRLEWNDGSVEPHGRQAAEPVRPHPLGRGERHEGPRAPAPGVPVGLVARPDAREVERYAGVPVAAVLHALEAGEGRHQVPVTGFDGHHGPHAERRRALFERAVGPRHPVGELHRVAGPGAQLGCRPGVQDHLVVREAGGNPRCRPGRNERVPDGAAAVADPVHEVREHAAAACREHGVLDRGLDEHAVRCQLPAVFDAPQREPGVLDAEGRLQRGLDVREPAARWRREEDGVGSSGPADPVCQRLARDERVERLRPADAQAEVPEAGIRHDGRHREPQGGGAVGARRERSLGGHGRRCRHAQEHLVARPRIQPPREQLVQEHLVGHGQRRRWNRHRALSRPRRTPRSRGRRRAPARTAPGSRRPERSPSR